MYQVNGVIPDIRVTTFTSVIPERVRGYTEMIPALFEYRIENREVSPQSHTFKQLYGSVHIYGNIMLWF